MRETDSVRVTGLADLAPGRNPTVVFHHEDGSRDEAETNHSLSEEQVEWFKAGSALNFLRARE